MSALELRLVLTERAQRDIQSLLLYTLQRWDADQVTTYEAAIHDTPETLRGQPNLGKVRDELLPGLRSYPVHRHVIFYRVESESLVGQRIVHTRMDVKRALLPKFWSAGL